MYAFLADVHLGVKLPNEDYLKSLNMFLGLIKEQKDFCKGIFVLGDLFDHRLSIDEAKFASLFIANLACNQCGYDGLNAPVYFIHGTYSHDLDQYDIFTPMLSKIPNIEIYHIKAVCGIKTKHGLNVLCIPHESGNIDYTQYLNEKWDMVVGHGVMASNTLNPCKSKEGIIHSAQQLGSISKLCVFGHYHGFTDFGNNTFYIGPWLRWQYGQDEERVFFFCDDNFKVYTRKNPFALEYKTIEIHNPEELREIISQNIDTPHRFKIESNEKDIDVYRGIILASKQNQNITFKLSEIESEVIEDKLDEDNEQSNNDASDTTRPIPDLDRYIKNKYKKDASKYLSEYESIINKEKKEL